ncbi:hypothetical protein GGI25_004071 [Coemansia spiralis]|uniref:Uncharacterized protein n=2 Tax=Coemansia TaxID=4863 RepID=A0A9W8G7B5_9FUNG|nr:hypothetical protein EDC05_003287 [Coemansia umbellata]KAJ2675231.1 hypothetical protein GGI25_004071 [Coemansia spiralis]
MYEQRQQDISARNTVNRPAVLSSASSASSVSSTSSASSSSISSMADCSRDSSTMLGLDALSPQSTALHPASDEYICAQLDQMGRRRLDSQCARLRPPKQLELSEILHRAGRLTANRMSNQDFMPQRRLESRSADGLDSLRAELSPERVREMCLASIAARLKRTSSIGDDDASWQHVEHPREHMRELLTQTIDRFKQMDDPAMDGQQRFHKPQQAPVTRG